MPRGNKRRWLAGGAAIGLAIAAAAQDAPKSLLPPGFGQAPPPPPAPAATPAPAPAPPSGPERSSASPRPTERAEPAPAPIAAPSATADEAIAESDEAVPAAGDLAGLNAPAEMPDAAQRSTALVGVDPVYGQDAFGDGDGRYIATLMRRVQTPIASRWAAIALRRLLAGATPAPSGESDTDWVADRAGLLLRLGEAQAARALVAGVDVANFSPRLRAAAIRSALASADPAALCPLPDGAEKAGDRAAWPMIRPMCATLGGDEATANASIGRAPPGDPIDHALAEKLVAAGGGGRRRVEVDWTAVDALTDWRFGLAAALGVLIPQPLLDAAPAWFQAWLAQAPMPTAAARVAPARVAAALGPLSGADLVDVYGQAADEAGGVETGSAADRLRVAFRGEDDEARLASLRELWTSAAPANVSGPAPERDRYAAAVLTARASTGIAPATLPSADVASLVGAMLAGGFDRQAARWARFAEAGDDADGDRAWEILAVGAERPVVAVTAKRVEAIAKRAGNGGRHKTAMLAAALAALDRTGGIDLRAAADIDLAAATPFARAVARAVDQRAAGTVLLLAAVGLQSERWSGVSPADFYRLLQGLRAVGLEGEARMIAAEAMTRL